MSFSDLDPDVRNLLSSLGSVDAVEVLLVLARAPERSWSSSQVGAMLELCGRIDPLLEVLARLNLTDVRLGSDAILYRYAPGSTVVAATVARLAEAYEAHHERVVASLRVNERQST